jgi:6,7-dimethyl-8-ribityllumazine synthase
MKRMASWLAIAGKGALISGDTSRFEALALNLGLFN